MARKRLPDEKQLSPPSIRIPLSLREQIAQSARCNRCSLNQEVILDHILDMVETGDNSREVRERLRQRQAELGTAEMERDALAQHHLVTTIKLGDADLRRVLKTMRDELQAPEVQVARRALQSFVERIEVNGDDVEIVYRPGVVLAAGTGDKFMPPRGFEPLHQA